MVNVVFFPEPLHRLQHEPGAHIRARFLERELDESMGELDRLGSLIY